MNQRHLVKDHSFLLTLLVGRQPYPFTAAHCYSTFYKGQNRLIWSYIQLLFLFYAAPSLVNDYRLARRWKSDQNNPDFFKRAQWPLIRVLLINAAIISDTALPEDLVLLREGWYEFTSLEPYLQVYAVISSHKGAEKVYIYQVPPSLNHPSTKLRRNKFFI